MLTESSPSFWRTDDRSPYVQRMWVWVSGDSLSSLSGLPMGSLYSQSCTHRWDSERNPISWSEALGKGALKARKCRDAEREELETGSPWHWAWLLLTQTLSCATKAPARLMVSAEAPGDTCRTESEKTELTPTAGKTQAAVLTRGSACLKQDYATGHSAHKMSRTHPTLLDTPPALKAPGRCNPFSMQKTMSTLK